VVDDEASILDITCQTLLAFGYRVLKATDGAEALGIYAEHKNEIAVVLTDLMMPILDGPPLSALKANEPGGPGRGCQRPQYRGQCLQTDRSGVKHFLTKPYTARTLLKACTQSCASREAVITVSSRCSR